MVHVDYMSRVKGVCIHYIEGCMYVMLMDVHLYMTNVEGW